MFNSWKLDFFLSKHVNYFYAELTATLTTFNSDYFNFSTYLLATYHEQLKLTITCPVEYNLFVLTTHLLYEHNFPSLLKRFYDRNKNLDSVR